MHTTATATIPPLVELLLLDPGTHDDSQAFRGTYWPRTIAQTDQNGRPVYPHKRSMVSYYASDGQRTSGAETSTEFIDPTTEVPSDEAWTRTHIAWPQAADVDANLVAMYVHFTSCPATWPHTPLSHPSLTLLQHPSNNAACAGGQCSWRCYRQ